LCDGPGEKFTAWKLPAIALNAVMEPSMLAVVLGVIESDGEVWLAVAFGSPCEGVSTFSGGVRLSDGLDVSRLRAPDDL
jgi:hypothetical protein